MSRGEWRERIRDSSGRDWYHPSVRALVDASTSGDPIEIILSKARALTDRARAVGWSGPAYDVSVLASLAGLRVGKPISMPEDEAAVLIGTAILTNVDHAIVRQRFSVCHEIVHPFFPDWQSAPRFTWRGDRDPDHEVELLCQLGAAELIMPYWCFEGPQVERGVDFQTAIGIAEEFYVSLEAAARRLISMSAQSVGLVILGLGHRKSEKAAIEMPVLIGFEDQIPEPRAKLRVVRVAALSPRLRQEGVYVPINKSIPDSSICYAALDNLASAERPIIFSADETWDLGRIGACHVEALGFHRGAGKHDGVMALVCRSQ